MHLLLLVLLAPSCSRKEESPYKPGTGGVRIDVATELPQTRADVAEGSLDPDDFKVEIINSKGVIFKRWATYAEYKSQENAAFVMNAGGPYTLRATYGDSTASGWDAWFFKGETQFSVLPQETVDVSTVCTMANVKVAVKYGDDIRNDYVDFQATVSSDKGKLVFAKDASEAGYMPVAPLTVSVELTEKADGMEEKKWYFKNSSEVTVAPGDFITLNVNTKPVPKVEPELDISIDYTTNDSTINVVLESFMLPKDAPSLVPDGFDAGTGSLSFVESTMPEQADVNLNVPEGIVACTMTTSSSYLTGQLGWPEEVDFFDLGGVKALIDKYGLLYTSDMSGQTMANIDFKGVAEHLKYTGVAAQDTHSFTIRVEDANGKTAEATYSLVPVEAEKTVSEIAPGDVWAARAYIDLTTNGNPELLYPEIKADGSEEWTKPTYTSSVSGSTNTVTITGLNPATKYSVRAGYNDFTTDGQEFTTEEARQVENAGFEEWSEWEYRATEGFLGLGAEDQTNYAPYISENTRWWDCNNSETTPDERTVSNIDYKSFPMVSYVSGRTGEKAAQLMVIAISNTATSGTAPSPTVGFGRIFTGVYGGEQGRSFPSRPDRMRLWYQYAPNDADIFKAYVSVKNGDTVIGEGTFTSSDTKTDWTELSVDITYSRTDLKADSIYIEFVSGSDTDKWDYNQAITYGGNKTANVHGGSILTIDDIELIYE